MYIVLFIVLIILAIDYSRRHKNDEVPEGGKKKKNPYIQFLKLLIGLILISAALLLILNWIWTKYPDFPNFPDFSISKSEINNYEEEYANQGIANIAFFPSTVPENATDVEFVSNHGIHGGSSVFVLTCTLPREEIEQYKNDYEKMKDGHPLYFDYSNTVRNFVGFEMDVHGKTTSVDSARYEIYAGEDSCTGCGFVIDNETNKIMFYFDETKCQHNR